MYNLAGRQDLQTKGPVHEESPQIYKNSYVLALKVIDVRNCMACICLAGSQKVNQGQKALGFQQQLVCHLWRSAQSVMLRSQEGQHGL